MLKGTEGGVKQSLANATVLHVFPTQACDSWVIPFSLGAPKLTVPPLKKCYRKQVSFQPAEALKWETFSVFRGILSIWALAALCLFFVPILPHSFLKVVATCPPLSHPALQSHPSIFYLASVHWFPNEIKYDSMLPARPLAMGILFFRRIHVKLIWMVHTSPQYVSCIPSYPSSDNRSPSTHIMRNCLIFC